MPVLYLLRHGETDFNVAQRLQGQYETRLNARGRLQAEECGALLRDLFDRDNRAAADLSYVSSPLNRARETMELVRATLGLDPQSYDLDSRLKEISYGEWEGLTLSEIQAREAQVLARRQQGKWDFTPPGGESYRDVATRVAAWHSTVTRDAVVVAHGGIVRVLMANFHMVSEEEAAHAEILHGVVYVFAEGTMARYS
jgi:broad specificity phosphatase PhoE